MLLPNLFWRRRKKTYRAKPPPARLRREINDRQAKVVGYDVVRYQAARICAVGAGGVNLPILTGLTMKGVRDLDLFDDDRVELSNLTRQPFGFDDVGQYKVRAAGQHLSARALFPLVVTAYQLRFEEHFSLERVPDPLPHLIACGVDNNATRRDVAAFALAHQIPVVFAAVGRDANAAAVFVQEPGRACWGCAHPHLLNDNSFPCGLPGTVDVLDVAAGHALYACDSLIGSRPRNWNLRIAYLDGGLPDRTATISRRPDCPLCADPLAAALPQAA